MLKQTMKLNCLMLHWNQISGIGGRKLAKAMINNNSIQIMDLSFNNMGIGSGGNNCVIAFKQMFKKNSTIVHLDISHNSFKTEQMATLGILYIYIYII